MRAVAVRIAGHRARAAVGHIDRRQHAPAVVLARRLPQAAVEHGDGDAAPGDAGLLQRVRRPTSIG